MIAGGGTNVQGGAGNTAFVVSPEAVLIQLRGKPLGGMRAQSLGAARQTLRSQRARVAADVLRLASRARPGVNPISREYATVFHGFAARLPKDIQALVRALPDVEAVHPDVMLRTTLSESVPLVGAPGFWTSLGYRGAGTTLAIVDSGVDYTHADLGGCIGPACKVKGGFDFINNDADPADDLGHGTHVAATAAGSGAFDGVAPDANILAYKVCDHQGNCPTSAILAGIERATDPNDDGTTSDHASVINLSLGGPGDASDPISQAVDSATAAGVVVVASAGNSGSSFFTVGSPGAARTAITVGATNNADQIANFSSRGPTATSFDLKPELTAPGVEICAAQSSGTRLGPACLDSSHVRLSGTSMAAPHVAGAAALLRGIFQTLAPADIKSLLVNNSVDLSLGAMTQGAGRLDVGAAAAARSTVLPAALSFGVDDPALPSFSANASLTVKNLDATARPYAITLSSLPAGITLSATPATFTLQPGESRLVSVALSVDNASVPNVQLPPYTYEGALRVDSAGQTQRVPFAFIKASRLRITSDVPPFWAWAHDRGNFSSLQMGNGATTTDLFVGEGNYDVVLSFEYPPNTFVFREGVTVQNTTNVTINKAEATHLVTFTSRDQNDQPLTPRAEGFHLLHRASQLSAATLAGAAIGPNYAFSPVSSAYDIRLGALSEVFPNKYLVTDGFSDGVSANRSLGNAAADLSLGQVRYYPRPGEVGVTDTNFLELTFPWGGIGVGFSNTNSPALAHDLYVTKARSPAIPMFYEKWLDSQEVSVHRSGLIRGTANLGVIDVFNFSDSDNPTYTTSTGELPINLGPAFWYERFYNSASAVVVRPAIAPGWVLPFHGQGGDGPDALTTPRVVPWALLSGSSVVQSGTFGQSGYGGPPAFANISGLGAGPYSFTSVGPEYGVGALTGHTNVRANFDLSRPDPNPPTMMGLALRGSDGKLTASVLQRSGGTLQLKFADESMASVTVSYGQPAVSASVTLLSPGTYRATIPNCQPGGVPLTIVATDQAGNSLRQDFTTGFECVAQACAGNSGFLNPSAQSADSGGDGNGFESAATSAFGDGAGNASNNNGAGDRHRYYNYNVPVPAGCNIAGIETRLDWWLDSTSGTNSMSVQLSWNGGASWTTVRTDTQETTTQHSAVLGGPTNTWGRTWTASQLSNANFRVRVISNSSSASRDFLLDWAALRVHYKP
ncbi:MAG TPA: S8 family serine peptidase [Polyangiaceae bacterium]